MILFRRAYEIFADYHQFYLMDAELRPYAPEDYTEDDVRKRIKTGDNIVVIQPERNMTVPVELEVQDSCPDICPEEWQHIAEASLELPSGRLLIEECAGIYLLMKLDLPRESTECGPILQDWTR